MNLHTRTLFRHICIEMKCHHGVITHSCFNIQNISNIHINCSGNQNVINTASYKYSSSLIIFLEIIPHSLNINDIMFAHHFWNCFKTLINMASYKYSFSNYFSWKSFCSIIPHSLNINDINYVCSSFLKLL